MCFSIGPSNKERIDAFETYHRAFKAKKLSESMPTGSRNIHIMMDIYGLEILIGPSKAAGTGFDSEISQKNVQEAAWQLQECVIRDEGRMIYQKRSTAFREFVLSSRFAF